MPFESGTLSFVLCHLPRELPEDAVERFAGRCAGSLESVQDEPQVGWVSGRHLLDRRIDEETAYAGGYLHLNLRTAERKIPASLLRAECKMAELALLQASGQQFLARRQRREIKQEVTERLIKDMPPTLSGVPFVVDPAAETVYVGAVSASQVDVFLAHFGDAIMFEPLPLLAETMAEKLCKVSPESLPVLRFSPEVERADSEAHLARDFLTWLWYFQEEEGGHFATDHYGEFDIMVEGPLTFAAEGNGAFESQVRGGMPTRSAEAKAALLVGKKLKRAKCILARQEQSWTFVLDADTFSFRGMTLPPGEHLEPQSHFQERVMFLSIFREAVVALLARFLGQVGSPGAHRALEPKLQQWVSDLQSA